MKHNDNVLKLIEKTPTDIKNMNVRRVTPYYYKPEAPTATTEVE